MKAWPSYRESEMPALIQSASRNRGDIERAKAFELLAIRDSLRENEFQSREYQRIASRLKPPPPFAVLGIPLASEDRRACMQWLAERREAPLAAWPAELLVALPASRILARLGR